MGTWFSGASSEVWRSTSRTAALMFPFAERTSFTGVYRNEARSEMGFLCAGMFSVQVFVFPLVAVLEAVL
jgi:hypothetical protein